MLTSNFIDTNGNTLELFQINCWMMLPMQMRLIHVGFLGKNVSHWMKKKQKQVIFDYSIATPLKLLSLVSLVY